MKNLFKLIQRSAKKRQKEKSVVISLRLSQSEHKALGELAFTLRSSRNWVICNLLRIAHEQMKKS